MPSEIQPNLSSRLQLTYLPYRQLLLPCLFGHRNQTLSFVNFVESRPTNGEIVVLCVPYAVRVVCIPDILAVTLGDLQRERVPQRLKALPILPLDVGLYDVVDVLLRLLFPMSCLALLLRVRAVLRYIPRGEHVGADRALLEATVHGHMRRGAGRDFGAYFNHVLSVGVLLCLFRRTWLDSAGLASYLLVLLSVRG